jgi:hypothetical protein
MVRGWCYNRQSGERLLSVEDIALACGVAGGEVKRWFTGASLRPVLEKERLFDAGEVVSLLVRNNIPFAPSLLPPGTRKILFIAVGDHVFQERGDTFDRICRFFADNGNILVETASAGRFADLRIFTFAPDIVVIFLQSYDRTMAKTLGLLSSLPDLKTILLLDDAVKSALRQEAIDLSADLVIGDGLPKDQLLSHLSATFGN